MKVQVLFGSQNDERVFKPLVDFLQPLGEVNMTVASAHRHPAQVREIVTADQADFFVAGAGLAAHLPGVVASLTSKCVCGVAVNGAFGGLDSFLSIVQMPKDIPVMCVTENNLKSISDYFQRLSQFDFKNLYLNWDQSTQNILVNEARKNIEKMSGLKIEWIPAENEKCMGKFVTRADRTPCQGLNLFVVDTSEKNHPALALEFFEMAQAGGLWVGMNNTTNFYLQFLKLKDLKGKVCH